MLAASVGVDKNQIGQCLENMLGAARLSNPTQTLFSYSL